MKHASTRALLKYWNDLRGTRTAPERADVDPSQIRNILVDTFILEVDRNTFQIRLVGDRTNCLFLSELKGKSFIDLWAAEDREDIQLLLSAVLDDAAPVVAGAQAAAIGRQPIDLEMLILPLRHNGRTHARMLGCIAPHNVASWFGLLPAGPLTLGSMRALQPDPVLGFVADGKEESVLAPAFDDGSFDILPVRDAVDLSGHEARPHGHLMVIEGGLSTPKVSQSCTL